MAAAREILQPIAGKRGRIVKLRLINFVTFESVECCPGPGLNIVIGPNGSGKSTLLSAIVLGLGGKPAVLGRSPSVQDYIKTGCNEAKVEIELEGEKKNVKIKRTISRDGRSTWHLNASLVAFKDIEKLTRSLNIQIDNLCQVLPQDRVQDFAKMNMQQLLDSTLKAVGKESISQMHSNLKELQKKLKGIETALIQDKARQEQEQGHVDRLQGLVEKIEKREGIEKEVEVCRSKLEILRYQSKWDECKRFKAQKEELERQIQEIRLKIEPFKRQINVADTKYREVHNKCAGMDRKILVAQGVVEKNDKALETKRHEILEVEVDKENKLKRASRHMEEVEKLRLKISRMRTDLASLEQMPRDEQKERTSVLQKAIENLARRISEIKREKLQIEMNVAQDRQMLNETVRNQQNLQNVKETRLRTLEFSQKDAFRAAKWIEQNQQLFEKTVYLPLCVELNVKDQQFAKYVESCIGHRDLFAFACESKNDFQLVIQELRTKQRLSINVLHINPASKTYNPAIDMSTLNQVCPGFYGYLKDFVTGPPTLLDWLCEQKHFHRIPIGNENVNPDKVPREINLYYAGNSRRSIRTSSYTGEDIRTCSSVPAARLLVNTCDPQELETLNQKVLELRQSVESANIKLNQLNSNLTDLESSRNIKRSELTKIQTLQSTYETQRFQLSQKERDLKKLEDAAIDPQKVTEEFTTTVKSLVGQLIGLQEPYYQALEHLEKCVRDRQLLQFSLLAAGANVKTQKKKCLQEQDALEKAQSNLEGINNTHADLRGEARRLFNAFEKRTKVKMDVFLAQKEDVLNKLPKEIDGLEAHIEEKMARAEMLGGANDREVMEEFENRVRQLGELVVLIERNESESNRITAEMTEKQNEWKTDLSALVGRINKNFSNYFKSMNCVGAVELSSGNDEHDYDNYGLRVRVKFRDSDELQNLNAHTQSGGERAVTTAIYMLSLQELTPVPFRLVDEINQGMDAINERRVYELLLASTSQPETPQYFLLTPKLLKNMPYSDTSTVLCIMNSPCAPDYRNWDTAKFLEIASRVNGHDDDMDEN